MDTSSTVDYFCVDVYRHGSRYSTRIFLWPGKNFRRKWGELVKKQCRTDVIHWFLDNYFFYGNNDYFNRLWCIWRGKRAVTLISLELYFSVLLFNKLKLQSVNFRWLFFLCEFTRKLKETRAEWRNIALHANRVPIVAVSVIKSVQLIIGYPAYVSTVPSWKPFSSELTIFKLIATWFTANW